MGPGTRADHGSGAMGICTAADICIRVTVNLPQSALYGKIWHPKFRPTLLSWRDQKSAISFSQTLQFKHYGAYRFLQMSRAVPWLVALQTFCLTHLRLQVKHDLHEPCTPHILIDGRPTE